MILVLHVTQSGLLMYRIVYVLVMTVLYIMQMERIGRKRWSNADHNDNLDTALGGLYCRPLSGDLCRGDLGILLHAPQKGAVISCILLE